MAMALRSPLAALVQSGLDAIGACPTGGMPATPQSPKETIEQLAGGLLAAMGIGEIADDLDLRALAILGAASVAGIQALQAIEPGIERIESAIFALEDLLRRTAPGYAG